MHAPARWRSARSSRAVLSACVCFVRLIHQQRDLIPSHESRRLESGSAAVLGAQACLVGLIHHRREMMHAGGLKSGLDAVLGAQACMVCLIYHRREMMHAGGLHALQKDLQSFHSRVAASHITHVRYKRSAIFSLCMVCSPTVLHCVQKICNCFVTHDLQPDSHSLHSKDLQSFLYAWSAARQSFIAFKRSAIIFSHMICSPTVLHCVQKIFNLFAMRGLQPDSPALRSKDLQSFRCCVSASQKAQVTRKRPAIISSRINNLNFVQAAPKRSAILSPLSQTHAKKRGKCPPACSRRSFEKPTCASRSSCMRTPSQHVRMSVCASFFSGPPHPRNSEGA
jgi:hypothetical protein